MHRAASSTTTIRDHPAADTVTTDTATTIRAHIMAATRGLTGDVITTETVTTRTATITIKVAIGAEHVARLFVSAGSDFGGPDDAGANADPAARADVVGGAAIEPLLRLHKGRHRAQKEAG